ncbi:MULTISPECIES: multiple monosaccharide ABC transporter ATP-binding protein [unclassified Rhizobium]|uniref:multiple monosaccharide ABC transporter ATP-binding protein n=1 Tax=unclassified Rhizobium TaxID=2613769 RepID=UPI00160B3C90|nr:MULTISPECIES: multiple monosaccharide ABC transporter ATP-binding protein [unclassified Rhizobium]MBB3315695.1 putative multiple sugar transport system ATP-binding protein [Rhizobium sp. BK181]MBB3541063.1 putative multiple sugar transport system ATP-binding protein [Rhizobium sp. BK399]MCS3743824.1 putative multiple sugar transport system ATP-binding protein [Rhizobium sp. BK661]MCS4093733.1 putative multiple sugar transport system ATP-binding protein [Rhizobium sp. BK176]
MDNTILEMRNITKTFPGVKALENVNLKVRQGEIHALVGENGAGKSTLMKVLSGVYPAGTYDGDIVYEGDVRHFKALKDSEEIGIVIIHQELALVPLLSIAENIFLGNEVAQNGIIKWQEAFKRTKELLSKVGLKESPETLVTDIGVGKQQLVEIAKALSKSVKLLILDEPTASLNEKDSDALLELLIEFRNQGLTSIIITHKLNEVRKVADQITVLRDGMTVKTLDCQTEEISEDIIIKNMVGRELADRYPPRSVPIGETILEVKNWNAYHQHHRDRQVLHNINVTVRKGEVVGIAGLMGAGRTEFAMSLFGKSYGHKIHGDVFMHGKSVDVSTVRRAIDAGLAYVTEDRKHLGLVLGENIVHNTTLANLAGVSSGTVIDTIKESKIASDYRSKLRIRSSSIFQEAVNLSGGNQQKVVLSKWLFSDPDVLILDEPTRGIDVGAKYEIYTIINQLAADGKGVLMISSEMPELLGTCDRIYVMNEGRIVAELPKGEASQETIMRAIMRSGEKKQ